MHKVIEIAETLPNKPGIPCLYIVHQQNGGKYTRDGFNSRWQAAREIAIQNHPDISFDFTFHDLKAKGISDLDGTLQEKKYRVTKPSLRRPDMTETFRLFRWWVIRNDEYSFNI